MGSFEYALDYGRVAVVNAFLESERLRNVFVTSTHILRALTKLSDLDCKNQRGGANRDSSLQRQEAVVNTLIGWAQTGEVITEQVAEKIVQLDLKDIWGKEDLEIQIEYQRAPSPSSSTSKPRVCANIFARFSGLSQ
jgi:hypothetical protein